MFTLYLVTYVFAAIVQTGGYGSTDMAALGATLGVLLFVCVVIIGFLIFRTRREKGDWHKIYETNMFRSSVSQNFRSHSREVIKVEKTLFKRSGG